MTPDQACPAPAFPSSLRADDEILYYMRALIGRVHSAHVQDLNPLCYPGLSREEMDQIEAALIAQEEHRGDHAGLRRSLAGSWARGGGLVHVTAEARGAPLGEDTHMGRRLWSLITSLGWRYGFHGCLWGMGIRKDTVRGFLTPDAALRCRCNSTPEGHALWTAQIKAFVREFAVGASMPTNHPDFPGADAWKTQRRTEDAGEKTRLDIAQALARILDGEGRHHAVLVGTRFCRLFVCDNGVVAIEHSGATGVHSAMAVDLISDYGLSHTVLPHALLRDRRLDTDALQLYRKHAVHAALAHRYEYITPHRVFGPPQQTDTVPEIAPLPEHGHSLRALWSVLEISDNTVKSWVDDELHAQTALQLYTAVLGKCKVDLVTPKHMTQMVKEHTRSCARNASVGSPRAPSLSDLD